MPVSQEYLGFLDGGVGFTSGSAEGLESLSEAIELSFNKV